MSSQSSAAILQMASKMVIDPVTKMPTIAMPPNMMQPPPNIIPPNLLPPMMNVPPPSMTGQKSPTIQQDKTNSPPDDKSSQNIMDLRSSTMERNNSFKRKLDAPKDDTDDRAWTSGNKQDDVNQAFNVTRENSYNRRPGELHLLVFI